MRRWLVGLLATSSLGGGTLFAADRAVNPYDDKATHFELPITSDIPQGERVEIAKDKAAMTLKGWNDEYAITITPQIPTAPTFGADEKIDRSFKTEPNRPLLSKKIEYREGDVTAFIEPKEGTQNEFDIDFTLHAKPETNVFEYKIEGAEEFDFHYQPELTPEEIAQGSFRPENVIGSYAVYHKDKANHRIGSTNYATGKAFHIYRPKAIDANGAEVWAQLDYVDGVLSVTVPQEFLDGAAYPVVVDPTFGYSGVGGTEGTIASNNARVIQKYSSTEIGTVTDLQFYTRLQNASTGKLRPLIYRNSDNVRIGYGPEVTYTTPVTPTSPVWKQLLIGTGGSVVATDYNLGIWQDSTVANSVNYYYDTDAAFTLARDNTAYHSTNAPPDPFTVNSSVGSRKASIYATYTADAGGGATPQDNTYFEILSAITFFQLAYICPRNRSTYRHMLS